MDEEIVATGQLYKQGSLVGTWHMRNFVLSNIYLAYFDPKTSTLKGKFDIRGCVIRTLSPEQAKKSEAKFAFLIEGPKKNLLVCASSERNRQLWIQILTAHIEEFKDEIRKCIFAREVILAKGLVQRKVGLVGFRKSSYLIAITNFPRLLLIDPATITVKEQLAWTPEKPALFDQLDKQRFVIAHMGKSYEFVDNTKGSAFWREAFISLGSVSVFVREVRAPINIGSILTSALGLGTTIEDDSKANVPQIDEEAIAPNKVPMKLELATMDVIASGELYKQGHQNKNWNRRNFVLSGIYLAYYDKAGNLKGKFDITNCTIRTVTAEECKRPEAKYAFMLEGRRKMLLVTASSNKNRNAWIAILTKQIEDLKDVAKRFVFAQEIVIGKGNVEKKVGLVNSRATKVLLAATTYPRLLVIDPVALVIKEQFSWTIETPATFNKIDHHNFSITIPGRCLLFEDKAQGAGYWKNVFDQLFSEEFYISKQQKYEPVLIDSRPPDENDEDEVGDLDERETDDAIYRRTALFSLSFFAAGNDYDDEEEEEVDVAAINNEEDEENMSNFDVIEMLIKKIESLLNSINSVVTYDRYPDEVHSLVMNAFADAVQVLMMILDTFANREAEFQGMELDPAYSEMLSRDTLEEQMPGLAVVADDDDEKDEDAVAFGDAAPAEPLAYAVKLDDATAKEVIRRAKLFIELLDAILVDERASISPLVEAAATEVPDDDDVDDNSLDPSGYEDEDEEGQSSFFDPAAQYSQRLEAQKEKTINLYSVIETATVEADTLSGHIAELLGGEAEDNDIEYEYYEDEDEMEEEGEQEADEESEDEGALVDEKEATHEIAAGGEVNTNEAELASGGEKDNETHDSVGNISSEISESIPFGGEDTSSSHAPIIAVESNYSSPLGKIAAMPPSVSMAFAYIPAPAEGAVVESFTSIVLSKVVDAKTEKPVTEKWLSPQAAQFSQSSLNHVEGSRITLAEEEPSSQPGPVKSRRTSITAHRPEGWNTQRLRRVQEMEMNDRKNGVPEHVIIHQRIARQQEVEAQMVQELKFSEKRKMFESKTSKPVFPKGFKG